MSQQQQFWSLDLSLYRWRLSTNKQAYNLLLDTSAGQVVSTVSELSNQLYKISIKKLDGQP